jgi:hypothetical protein
MDFFWGGCLFFYNLFMFVKVMDVIIFQCVHTFTVLCGMRSSHSGFHRSIFIIILNCYGVMRTQLNTVPLYYCNNITLKKYTMNIECILLVIYILWT